MRMSSTKRFQQSASIFVGLCFNRFASSQPMKRLDIVRAMGVPIVVQDFWW